MSEDQIERGSENKQIGEVSPIEENRSSYIRNRSEIPQFVEPPLVRACEILYDNNVRTLSTTANRKDVEYDMPANIVIDFDSLSPENKELARQVGEIVPYDKINAVILKHRVSATTPTKEIEEWASSLAKKFKKQPMTWAVTFTYEQILEWAMTRSWKNLSPEELAREVGYFYDRQSGFFYVSEEHYHKVKESE